MSICCLSEQEEMIQALIYSTNGLSIFGSFMVILTYFFLPKLRENRSRRFLAYLNISNLLYGVAEVFIYQDIFINQSIPQNPSFKAIFFASYCFRYTTFIWPLILAINLYQIVAKRNNNLTRYEFLWLFIGFVIPIMIVFTLNCFGLIQFHQSITVIITQYIIPIILMVFFILSAYFKSIKASKLAFGEEEEAKKFIKMILPYPLITIVISIPVCVFNIMYSSEGCFTLLSSAFLSVRFLQGALDAIVFGFNPTLREEIRKYFRKNNETSDSVEILMNSVT